MTYRSRRATYDRFVTSSPANPGTPTPTLTLNRAQYAPGNGVTFTGTAWDACPFGVTITLGHGTDFTFINEYTPENGSFQGTFAAPNALGTHVVDGHCDAPECVASVTFEVVAPS